MTDDEPRTRARRVPGWADIPAMDPPPVYAREVPALVAITAVLDRLKDAERRRVLAYVTDRYEVVEAETAP